MTQVRRTRVLLSAAALLFAAACSNSDGKKEEVTLEAIELTPATPSVAKGLNIDLKATGIYSDQSKKELTSEVTWSSSSPAIAQVENTGRVKGVSVGNADITASIQGKSGTTRVTVTAATVNALTATAESTTVAKGFSTPLTATATLSDGTKPNVTSQVQWTTSNSAVVTVTNGQAKAVGVGTARITAALQGKEATIDLTVTNATLVTLTLEDVSSTSLAKGTSLQLKANGKFSDDSVQELTGIVNWTSSDTTKATVSTEGETHGLVTAVAAGPCRITATYMGKTAQIDLTITAAELLALALATEDGVAPEVYESFNLQLVATGSFDDESEEDVTADVVWTSDNEAVATVSNAPGEEGRVTGHSPGTATITVTKGSVTANFTVTVHELVLQTIRIENLTATPVGLTAQLKAIGTYNYGPEREITGDVTWTSDDTDVAAFETESKPGLVTAKSVGTVQITATLGTITDDADFDVTDAELVSIEINGLPTGTFFVGDGEQLTARGTFTDGSEDDLSAVTWESSDPTVATVTDGLLTGVSAGTVTITAKKGEVEVSEEVSVTAVILTSIAIDPAAGTSFTVPNGATLQLTATGTYNNGTTQDLTDSATWESEDPTVATVGDGQGTKGLVTGVDSTGTTKITATVDGITGQADVTAAAPALTRIEISGIPASITEGDTFTLVATGFYSDGSSDDVTAAAEATWASLDEAKATVAAGGVVHAVSFGQATVKITLGDVNTTAQLTIKAGLNTINVTGAKTTLIVGDDLVLTAAGKNSDGSNAALSNVVWSSTDMNVATVDSTGKVTAIAPGTVTIKATVGTIAGSFNLTVEKKLVAIAVTSAGGVTSIEETETLQLTATATYSHGAPAELSNVTWSSNDEGVATVDSAGVVTAVSEGTVKIKALDATTGVYGEFDLTVTAL